MLHTFLELAMMMMIHLKKRMLSLLRLRLDTNEDRLDYLIPSHEFFHQGMVVADCKSELFRDGSRGLEGGAFFLATLLNRKEAQTSKGRWWWLEGRRRSTGCWSALKVWGTERMSELQGQDEVWNHLQELWIVVREKHRLESINVNQAVGLVKIEVCIISEGGEGMELLADILVKENLLVPDKEFLESLDRGDGA